MFSIKTSAKSIFEYVQLPLFIHLYDFSQFLDHSEISLTDFEIISIDDVESLKTTIEWPKKCKVHMCILYAFSETEMTLYNLTITEPRNNIWGLIVYKYLNFFGHKI